MLRSLVGSEMCIRDSDRTVTTCNTNARCLPHVGSTTFGKDLRTSTLSDLIPLGCKALDQVRPALCLPHQSNIYMPCIYYELILQKPNDVSTRHRSRKMLTPSSKRRLTKNAYGHAQPFTVVTNERFLLHLRPSAFRALAFVIHAPRVLPSYRQGARKQKHLISNSETICT